MKIIIIGAGELGRLLATFLSADKHDIAIIDASTDEFEQLRAKLDIATYGGDATSINTALKAGIRNADMLLAVSGDQNANILACQIARHFGVNHTICRLYSYDVFSEKDGITPAFYGIEKTFSSPGECARKVLDVLRYRIVLERMLFSNEQASMAIIEITQSSPLASRALRDVGEPELLADIRFAALVRNQVFIVPRGATRLMPGDKVYVAGQTERVNAFIERASRNIHHGKRRVIISGTGSVAVLVARGAIDCGWEVRLIEREQADAEALLAELPQNILVFHGNPNDEDVMREAGIADCDTFISLEVNDESSILSCIMAKRLGARKVVTVTHKPEYIDIVPAMEVIDCGFNASLVSLNAISRLMETGKYRLDARLQSFHAYVNEYTVTPDARIAGQQLKDCHLPESVNLAMLFRNGEIISPQGKTVLLPGDKAVAVVTPKTADLLEPFFNPPGRH